MTDRPQQIKKYCDDEIRWSGKQRICLFWLMNLHMTCRAEELFLPTSRIEKKRRQLIREYDRAKKREDKKKNELRKKLSIDDAGIIRELNVNEYEKNKARNHKTNIQFPTPISTVRSDRSSRSRKPSRSSSAQPKRSQSAYRRSVSHWIDGDMRHLFKPDLNLGQSMARDLQRSSSLRPSPTCQWGRPGPAPWVCLRIR